MFFGKKQNGVSTRPLSQGGAVREGGPLGPNFALNVHFPGSNTFTGIVNGNDPGFGGTFGYNPPGGAPTIPNALDNDIVAVFLGN